MAPGGQTGRVHRHNTLCSARARLFFLQTAHHFSQSLPDDALFQAQHETKKCAVIRHRLHLQRPPQLSMLAQANLGPAESPILISHQTQNGQQLRLGKTLRRKTVTVRRQNFPRYFQRDTGKWHQSNFAHALPIYTQRPRVQVPFQQSQVTSTGSLAPARDDQIVSPL